MTNQEIIDRVREYNVTFGMSKLLCRLFSSHSPMEAREENGEVKLFCTGCKHSEPVPEIVFSAAALGAFSAQEFMRTGELPKKLPTEKNIAPTEIVILGDEQCLDVIPDTEQTVTPNNILETERDWEEQC